MVLTRKTKMKLNRRQQMVVDLLLDLNVEEGKRRNKSQTVFYQDQLKKLGSDTLRIELPEYIKEILRGATRS